MFRQSNVPIASQTVAEYRRMAESGVYATPVHGNYDDLERKYWKTIAYGNPIYGAGVSGTLFDDTVDVGISVRAWWWWWGGARGRESGPPAIRCIRAFLFFAPGVERQQTGHNFGLFTRRRPHHHRGREHALLVLWYVEIVVRLARRRYGPVQR